MSMAISERRREMKRRRQRREKRLKSRLRLAGTRGNPGVKVVGREVDPEEGQSGKKAGE
jgi:hypothetical protein